METNSLPIEFILREPAISFIILTFCSRVLQYCIPCVIYSVFEVLDRCYMQYAGLLRPKSSNFERKSAVVSDTLYQTEIR